MSISKEQLDKLLKEKGIEPNKWTATQDSVNNPYIQKQVELLESLKGVLTEQVKKDKSLLNELIIQKSKSTKKE